MAGRRPLKAVMVELEVRVDDAALRGLSPILLGRIRAKSSIRV